NDGDFPRNTKAAVFDLIAKHPAKGDRARRDDDRYLFLEALISAREILYLSYIGRDIRKDEELAPSSLLGELIDTVAAMAGIGSRQLAQNWIEQHPLQAF
ncbi:exodeoxyribonuclease V subunit gamma, partial [Klebsiella pneumoniae]|nr:exodeoxyribonuclease V subunit gamma [Klebsiella pneumoniae]